MCYLAAVTVDGNDENLAVVVRFVNLAKPETISAKRCKS